MRNKINNDENVIINADKRAIKFIIDLKESVAPDSGLVPNKETAVKIAKAVWTPIYGDENMNYNRYAVALVGDTAWVVTRSFVDKDQNYRITNNTKIIKVDFFGGAPYILIRKKDAKILKVTHTK